MGLTRTARWMAILQGMALFFCLLSIGNFFRRGVISEVEQRNHRYVGYYAATRLWLEDRAGPQIYDNEWYMAYTRSLTQGAINEVYGPNLPTMVMIALPSAFFSFPTARIVWIAENMLLTGLGIAFLLIAIRAKQNLWFYFVAIPFFFFFPPLLRNIELGQAYLMVFFFLTFAAWGMMKEKDWATGLGLAFALTLKSSGPLLWFIPLLRQQWRVFFWSVGTSLLLMLITLPRLGLVTWAAYIKALLSTNSELILTATAYQSIPGLFNHLFRYHEVWSPEPLMDAPALAWILVFVTGIVSLSYTLWAIRSAPIDLQITPLLTLNILLVPLVEEYQLVLLLIPIVLLAADLLARPPIQQVNLFLLFLLGVALLTLPFPYKDPAIHRGWLSLLAYPRLYGGVLLWLVAILLVHKDRPKYKR